VGFVDLFYQKAKRSKSELIEHLKNFRLDTKLSVGMWYLAQSSSRFQDRYGENKTIQGRIKIIYELAELGIKEIEAHYPSEKNEENCHLYQQLEKDTLIHIVNTGPFIFYDKEFEFGSLSNPILHYREKATNILTNNLRFVKAINAGHCGIWPGIDIYTYSLGTPFCFMWEAFEEAVANAMDAVPGVRDAIEPKPYEPIPNNIY